MKILLSILAVASALLGVAFGGIWLWITIASLWHFDEFWTLLIGIPFLCFGAIAIIIGVRYLRRFDAESAKGVAGMTGFVVWAVINPKASMMKDPEEPDLWFWIYFLGPIICGILTYRILLWCIKKTMNNEPNNPEGDHSAISPGSTML